MVPTEQYVEVAAYNVLGQRVRALFAGRFDAGQKRTFVLEAEALPSGIYLYRAHGETFTATRRVLALAVSSSPAPARPHRSFQG